MSTYEICRDAVKHLPSFEEHKTFEAVPWFRVGLPEAIVYRAKLSQIVTVTKFDTNAEFDHFYKCVKKLNVNKA